MSSRKEAIEKFLELTTDEDLNNIITNSSDKIELYITGLTENKHDIRHYKQDETDVKWFSFVKHDCKNRQEEINQLRGTIEMLLEDEDFNI